MSKAQRDLVHQLIAHGPVKVVSASGRRVRALLGGHYIVDTTEAYHVWEHPHYPQFYVPYSAFRTGEAGAEVQQGEEIKEDGRTVATTLRVSVGDRSTHAPVYFEDVEQSGRLGGLVRVTFGDFDQFFEEDEPVYVHPKDPSKRIALLPSSRSVEVRIDGHVVAKATHCIQLIEPLLPVRYYLPPAAVDPAVLRATRTRSRCPYKGEAEYYDVVVGGETYPDIVWWYRYPTPESLQITGLLTFYNERVDVWLDGVKQERPKSKFA